MPDVVGVAPQAEVLQVPNNVYRRPENPMESLKSKTVQGVQDFVAYGPRQNVAETVVEEPAPRTRQPQVAVYNPDTPQEATGDHESHDSPQEHPSPQGEIKGSPYARIRVLEREREIERRRSRELEDQVALLAKVVDKAGIMDSEEEEEELPTDPLSQIARAQQATLKEIHDFKEESKKKEQAEAEEKLMQVADHGIRAFIEKANSVKPGLYQEAMAHLANVKISEFLEDDDSITEDEAKIKLAQWVVGLKEKAARSGKNPGEELLRRSVLHGYNVNIPAPSQSGRVSTQSGKENASDKIAKEKERKAGLGSISTVHGSPAADPVRNLANIPEKERVRAIMQSQKEKGQYRRSAPLSELLAHKIRR